MVSYKEAQHIIKSNAQNYGNETISISSCIGRVLGENIKADRDYPPFNRSAMDGLCIEYGWI